MEYRLMNLEKAEIVPDCVGVLRGSESADTVKMFSFSGPCSGDDLSKKTFDRYTIL